MTSTQQTATAGSDSPTTAHDDTQVGRSWYAAVFNERRASKTRRATRRPRLVFSTLAGVRFWLGARRRYPAVETMTYLGPPFWLLERFFGRRGRYLIVLEFITLTDGSWLMHGRRKRVREKIRSLYIHQIVAPALRKSLLAAQVLSTAEARNYAAFFEIPIDRFHFLPWMRSQSRGELPELDGRRGVFASGRAFCNWEEVFSIAQGQSWSLTVMCSAHDFGEVQRMNRVMLNGRAIVLCDQPRRLHDLLLRSSAVYLLALREEQISAGHIRLAASTEAGTPTVVTAVSSIRDYVGHDEDALVYEPGDVTGAQQAVAALIADAALSERVRARAHEKGHQWTRAEYVAAIRQLVSRSTLASP